MTTRIVISIATVITLSSLGIAAHERQQAEYFHTQVTTLSATAQQCANKSAELQALLKSLQSSADAMRKAPKDKF